MYVERNCSCPLGLADEVDGPRFQFSLFMNAVNRLMAVGHFNIGFFPYPPGTPSARGSHKALWSSSRNMARSPCWPARASTTKWGVGRLCRLRVTLDRAARCGLFPRGERPVLATRRHPRQDRKALRNPGFPFQEGRLQDALGWSRGNTDPGLAGWGFLTKRTECCLRCQIAFATWSRFS